jgi:ribosomal protein S14
MLIEGQLAATEEEEEEKEEKREDKWWDTCLSCGKPQQVYKEIFSLIFFQQLK